MSVVISMSSMDKTILFKDLSDSDREYLNRKRRLQYAQRRADSIRYYTSLGYSQDQIEQLCDQAPDYMKYNALNFTYTEDTVVYSNGKSLVIGMDEVINGRKENL